MLPLFLLALAAVTPVDRIYIFGDSYSDIGAGYLDGNGPTAVAYLAGHLGTRLLPANRPHPKDASLGFAVSGAGTGSGGGTRIGDALLGLGMRNQVDDFASRVRSQAIAFNPESTLFFIAGGLNDASLPSAATVANIKSEIRTLYESGARRFLIAILPTAIPAFTQVATRLNPELSKIPQEIQSELPAASIALSHWGPFFDEVMHNPAAFGIENTKDACAGRAIFNQDATPCDKPAAYFYYHSGHPSTAVHKVVGQKLYQEVLHLAAGR